MADTVDRYDDEARQQRLAEVADDPKVMHQRLEEIKAHIEGRWEPWFPWRAAPPPGREWFVDIPGRDGMRVYIVRRRFTADDGTVANRDEIICPESGFWEDKTLRMILFNNGWLEPLTERVLGWMCPHVRFWATREAIEAHGCCELPAPEDEEREHQSSGPKGRGAEVIRLWQEGLDAAAIGEHLGMSARSASKRIVSLRKKFGETLVPKRG